jgi:6-phosphogluconolactonase
MSQPNIQILDDPVRVFAEALMAAASTGGHVALTGGSTPKAAYEMAARQPEAFAGARLWFGDERCVPPEDDRSNYGMAKQALLDPLAAAGIEIGVCRRMEGELGPDAGADAYARALAAEGVAGGGSDGLRGPGDGVEGGGLAVDGVEGEGFELILLGIGPDGHIASLFPGQTTLEEEARLVIGVPEAGHEPYVPRVSLTFPGLALARQVILLATGASKADAVSAAFAPDATPTNMVPASLLAGHVTALTVLLDADAAGRL